MSEMVKYNLEETSIQTSAIDKLNELNSLISKKESNSKSLFDLKRHEFRTIECQIIDFPISRVKLDLFEFKILKETLIDIFEKRKNKIEVELSKFNVTKNGL